MLQDPEKRGRIVAGAALILLGVAQIISNSVDATWEVWLWIAALAVSAVGFGWLYQAEREAWQAIVAYICAAVLVIVIIAAVLRLGGVWVPVIVLLLIAAPFAYSAYRTRQWGLAIPAYVLAAIIPVLFLGEAAGDIESELVPAYVLIVIGLPFIVAFFYTRQWPFLIPGGIMLLLGVAFLFSAVETLGPIISGAVALILIVAGVSMLITGRRQDRPRREG